MKFQAKEHRKTLSNLYIINLNRYAVYEWESTYTQAKIALYTNCTLSPQYSADF